MSMFYLLSLFFLLRHVHIVLPWWRASKCSIEIAALRDICILFRSFTFRFVYRHRYFPVSSSTAFPHASYSLFVLYLFFYFKGGRKEPIKKEIKNSSSVESFGNFFPSAGASVPHTTAALHFFLLSLFGSLFASNDVCGRL